ncbi:Protein-export protein SecB [Rickettsiales endosymbiont of Paramecium tredecaurelia]|uniref:protein-export chaperone SecB n=1 Tax=Candidatus Sarmatiella mevalonica TaxID=2770581 RepID=UPI00192135F1|nr:protein-export chaperone SecB [Candidatus Sarmatiella mevalonica]MBL3285091.1 Protein-export protein SecB [Candidatus Sarmatiella mevalonica]
MSEAEKSHISIQHQYLKDLSFENPSSPASVEDMSEPPQLGMSLDLAVRGLEEEHVFEVQINISVKAHNTKLTLFIVEVKYAGVFRMINIPQDQYEFLLSVYCPSILFPFVRRIISDITRDGGFQPLMIEPIDFAELYHKKKTEMLTKSPDIV